MGKNAPAASDYTGAAEKTAEAGAQMNRPNQTNAFGSSTNWTQGPDGTWQQSQSFGGPMAGLSQSLQGQAANAMGTPFDTAQFGTLGTGDAAREQAIDAAYTQAASRLDPQWEKRESANRTRLLNQGLSENSEAFKGAMGDLGQQRNDAYTSAMASAIGQGTAAGSAVFGQNMAQRQQLMSEALRSRQMPMQELSQMQAFLQQPGFQSVQGPNYLQAAMGQDAAAMNQWQAQNGANADMWGGIMDLAKTGATIAASDERVKLDVVRLDTEALPGVRYATWRYRPEEGKGNARHIGVIAQDLARVAPQYVHRRADGMLMVDYSFLSEVSRG